MCTLLLLEYLLTLLVTSGTEEIAKPNAANDFKVICSEERQSLNRIGYDNSGTH